ncbi:MAG: DnaJ domain-containing protein [Rhodospirillales bacterium]
MIVWLIVGVVVAIGVVLIMRGFAGAEPRTVAKVVRWMILVIGGALAGFLLFTGRGQQALFTLIVLGPMLMRWKAMFNRLKGMMGPKPGQSSSVGTAYLDMELDHDSGRLDGAIKAGNFAGRPLGDLSVTELVALLAECRAADPQSVALIEAFLDRNHPDWRGAAPQGDGGAAGGGGFAEAMTPDEARRILELDEGADEDAVKDAHRRLMMKIHPDQGGSTYLAAKINQAKDVLLKRRR